MRFNTLSFTCAAILGVWSQAVAAPNFTGTISRPLRYQPVGGDFLATDGTQAFNRPLYGSGTAFRVDAGDRPEFSLFLPGRGGVLRLGIWRGGRAIWLIEAESIDARYRPGSMHYTLRDPMLGDAELRVSVMASFVDEALLAKIELRGETADLELIAAFGGANGERGSRNGDLGTEKLPVREFFALQPDHCKDNRFEISDTGFSLASKPATLVGRSQPAMRWSIGDAAQWKTPAALIESKQSDTPVAVGRAAIRPGTPIHLRIDRIAHPSTQPGAAPPRKILESDFDADFAESELIRRQIANRLVIDTPDPFLNAAATALNVAAEGTWDAKETAIMHGAVAWRNKLLGWRGLYWPDALGMHERFPEHVDDWFAKQNAEPIPAQIPPPEAGANLARNEDALHSNGNLTDNHYDMNLVAIDGLFRHLLWTGDREYAKRVWPVIERHLAWERRMFRREFGPEKSPLYEGYACIWASDDLWYNGGGATHASACNAFHNRMAAKVASWIGEDPAPYDKEADEIVRAMRTHLWIKESGHYAEWKDLLGEQLVHPSAAAWTVYHAIDSRITTPQEAWSLARYAATALPRIPIKGENVPMGTFQIATSNWFPYQWSTNNVVMAESAHTALAMFQANRSGDAYALLRGAILDSMYLGQCPGNVGMCTPLDMARGETQRDFADGCGALSRAIVEGLFGIEPDAIEGRLTLSPRFPADWDRASIRHADLDLAFTRSGDRDSFEVQSRLPNTRTIRLVLPARREREQVTINGVAAAAARLLDGPSGPQLVIEFESASADIQIRWSGEVIAPTGELVKESGEPLVTKAPTPPFDWSAPLPPTAKLETVDLAQHFNAKVTDIFRNEYLAPRSGFVSLAVPRQGIGSWCKPTKTFDVDDAGLRASLAKHGGTLTLPSGVVFRSPSDPAADNILFTSQWSNYPKSIRIPLSGRGSRVYLLVAGSTQSMQSQFDNGEVILTYADGSTARLALRNPETWWPIDQDYAIDDFAFRYDGTFPPRVDLKTGNVRVLSRDTARGKGRVIDGGAATVLNLPLDPTRELKSLEVRAIANEVVIGLMAVTLERAN